MDLTTILLAMVVIILLTGMIVASFIAWVKKIRTWKLSSAGGNQTLKTPSKSFG